MSNTISVTIGILCAILMCVALIPFLGWLNWLVVAGCVFGIIFGAISERKKSGLTINAAVAAVGMLRLLLGGGVL